jgi:hypothetical protein
MFAIAAATLLLVFIGIHNAWDTVTWLTTRKSEANESGNGAEAGASSNGAAAKREETATT